MIAAVTIILILLLFIYSFTSIEKCLLAYLLLAALLPTMDRLAGGLPFTFGAIKIPFLFIGLIYFSFRLKIRINSSYLKSIGYYVLFIVIIIIASYGHSTISMYDIINFSGLLFFPLFIFFAVLPFNFEKFFNDSINYLFIWAALFGIFQYIIGPSGFAQLGFQLVTPNTESSYSDTYSSIIGVQGIRPFSFFANSASFAAIMFFAVIGIFVMWPNDKKLLLPKSITIPILLIGITIAQFKSIIFMVLICLFIYYFKYKRLKILSKKILIVIITFISIVFSISFLFPDVWNHIAGSTSMSREGGGVTSLAARLMFFANFPYAIKGHFWRGYGYFYNSDLYTFTADAKLFYFILLIGIPAAISYLLIQFHFLKIGKTIIRKYELESYNWKIGIICLFTFFTIIINNVSNGHLETTAPANIFVWIIGGISLRIRYNKSFNTKQSF